MRKKALEKRLARLNDKLAKLSERCAKSEDVAEVRSLTEQVEETKAEIEETKTEIEAIEAEEREAEEARSKVPAGATLVNGTVAGSFQPATQKRDAEDVFATMEYRKAFMKYAQTGEQIPASLIQRDGTPANTESIGATIPTTVLNEFINEVRLVYGNLYNKVRKMNIKGAVKVPIAQLMARAKWVSEGTVSPRQDAGNIKDFVEFSYNMLELRVSQTLLSQIVDLGIFEREIVGVMVTAYLREMGYCIVKGTGIGQPLGILNDPRVINQEGHIIEMSSNDINDWTKWRKNFFAKLPLGYRKGEFIFPLATVDAYLETMADNNNNPIFRQATGLEVNDGDARYPNGRFFGHDISLVEPDILPDFDSANVGDIVGIFWQPNEYAVNTNEAFGMTRWKDEDRNEWVYKMLTVVDGKVLNPRGIYLIKKK